MKKFAGMIAIALMLMGNAPTEQIPLPRQLEPHWQEKIIEKFPSGQPAQIVFSEKLGDGPETAVKIYTYHANTGRQKQDIDVIVQKDAEGKEQTIPNGVEMAWDDAGHPERIASYKLGRLDGDLRLFYPSGQVKLFAHFNDGKREGKSVAYHQDGVIAEEMSFKNDKLEGEVVRYYPKGGKAAVIPYKDGVPHGTALEWNEGGSLKISRHFENGSLNSDGKKPAVVVYGEGHAFQEVQDFRMGEPIGTHVKYHPNGKEAYKVSFKEGKKEGKEQFFGSDGKLIGEGEYRNGTPIGKHFRNHENGKPAFLSVFDNEGEVTGPIQEWNDQGQKTSEYSLKNDRLDGSFKQWYDNGNLKTDSFYVNGEFEGSQKEFFSSGKLKTETHRPLVSYSKASPSGFP